MCVCLHAHTDNIQSDLWDICWQKSMYVSYKIGFMFIVIWNVQHVNYFTYYLKAIKCSCFTFRKNEWDPFVIVFLTQANGPRYYLTMTVKF